MAGRVRSDGAMKPKAKVGREDNKLLLGVLKSMGRGCFWVFFLVLRGKVQHNTQ